MQFGFNKKRMKKMWFVLALFVFAVSGSQAQDAKAGAILDAMSKKYKDMKAFTADFSYNEISASGKSGRVRSGSIAVKGVKFKLNMVGQEIYNNGSEIYSFVKETNEVNVTTYDSSEDSQFSPANIYSIYKKGYRYKFLGEKSIGGKAHEVVELVPTNKGSNISKLVLTIDKGSKTIKNWKITDSSGKNTVFNIVKFGPNVNLSENYFSFDSSKHPGVEIVDLR
ncbi:MAG: outer membrane lipoprotein carrier protein [Arcticibacterium sp.]|jgi:outer membrane lipoprotein carrier protein